MDIRKRARELNDYVIEVRRELHATPEVSHDLPVTESVIVRELEKLGLDEIRKGQGSGHGVYATLKGKKAGKVLALRADADALPVKEETGLPFASTNGNMHACGHDAHVAMLLGAAKLLAEARDELTGAVRFIFQPAEETFGGATGMIESGALENPKVDAVIGLHTGNIWEGVAPGRIGWIAGPMMASTCTMKIVIEGKGGHGAMPHLTVDPIVIAAETVAQLQTLVSREISPFDPAVVTVGSIAGGKAHNVIAENCVLMGTVRAFSPETDSFLRNRVRATVEGVAASMRGSASVEFYGDLPAVINDPRYAVAMRDILTAEFGAESVQEISLPTTGGEDFSYYLLQAPGAFFFHCSKFGDERDVPHHNPKFDINESVLWTGVAAMAAYALRWQE